MQVVSGLAGIASPVVFVVFVVVAGVVVPDYDHVTQHVSELAQQGGEHAWVMRTGLVLVGCLNLVLARGLRHGIGQHGWPGWLAPWMVGAIGIATIGTALFSVDSDDHSGSPSTEANLHVAAATTAFVLDVLTPLAFAARLGADWRWRPLRGPSIVAGALAAVLLVPVALGLFPEWKGIVQRLFLVVPFAWTGLMGFWLLRMTRSDTAKAPGRA